MVGIAGFYGFSGNYFSDYSKTADADNWPIAQNCITMFQSDNILAFIIQIVMLVLCASTYPLVNIFIIQSLTKMYKEYSNQIEISDEDLLGNNYNKFVITLNTLPFLITIFIPQIATVLGKIGCFVGLFVVYILPVITYLKYLKSQCK